MSLSRLGRGRGISIQCDIGLVVLGSRKATNSKGEEITEHVYAEPCECRSITGNIRTDVNRAHAIEQGWCREKLPVGPRRRLLDICPGCTASAKQVLADLEAKKKERQAKRARKAAA